MTDEELDALMKRVDDAHYRLAIGIVAVRDVDAVADARATITTLRSQLADARAERDKMGRALNVAKYGQPDFSWELHKMAMQEAVEQRDRAEAALAAQIEAAACDCPDAALCQDGCFAAAIRAIPHDRTALDAMLRAAEEKALQEAATWHDREAAAAMNSLHCGSENSEYRAAGRLHDFHKTSAAAILALIPREDDRAKGGE